MNGIRSMLVVTAIGALGFAAALILAYKLKAEAKPAIRESSHSDQSAAVGKEPRSGFVNSPVTPVAGEAAGGGSSPVGGVRLAPLGDTKRDVNLGAASANLMLMLQAGWAGLESPNADLDQYMLHWRTVTKAQAAWRKLLSGDYEYRIDDRGGLVETSDTSFMAVSDGKGALVFKYQRDVDTDVFSVIDQCAGQQQEAWGRAVEEFNALSQDERVRRIGLHKQALKEIRDLVKTSVGRNGERVAPDLPRIEGLRGSLLPAFMVILPGGSSVVARKSIGR